MKCRRLIQGLLLLSWLAFPLVIVAQSTPLFLDGETIDWMERTPAYEDIGGDQASGNIDFSRVWVDNDDRFLFIAFETTGEVLLQSDNALSLHLDTDDDASTGLVFDNVGAELIWTFADRAGQFVVGQTITATDHRDIGMASAPTVSSTWFEIVIDLAAKPDNKTELFPADTVSLLIRDANGQDRVPDAGIRLRYGIDRTAPSSRTPTDLDRPSGSHIRFVTYNVEQDGLFDAGKKSIFGRILRALDPDIIGFQEVFNHSAAETVTLLSEIVPLDDGERWYASGTGSDIILASRYPITRTVALQDADRFGNAAFMVDLRPDFTTELFVIVAHPRCCEQDALRQNEVDEIMAHLRDSQIGGTLPNQTPFIIAGDMNFVGDSQQLKTLLEGDIVGGRYQPSFAPDWDGSNLKDVVAPTSGLPMTFTWTGASFSPGRLDYIIYSDAVMSARNGLSLHTLEMTSEELAMYGLFRTDTGVASDHQPVAADFQFLNATQVSDEVLPDRAKPGSMTVFPNPVRGTSSVTFSVFETGPAALIVYDVLGREIFTMFEGAVRAGENTLSFDASGLRPAVYLMRLMIGSEIRSATFQVSGR